MSSLDENGIVLRHLIRQYFTASKSSKSMNSALSKKGFIGHKLKLKKNLPWHSRIN